MISSGGRIRTYDLWVMSPASYRAAPPRDAVSSINTFTGIALSGYGSPLYTKWRCSPIMGPYQTFPTTKSETP